MHAQPKCVDDYVALEKIYSVALAYTISTTFRVQSIMTEESKPQSNEEESTKLMIDRPSDFRFHAAYLAYSETWDKTMSQETKKELNEIMSLLSKEEISYSSFYKRLDEHRRQSSTHYDFPRQRIETQRKRDWRKRQNKDLRNARYRGKR